MLALLEPVGLTLTAIVLGLLLVLAGIVAALVIVLRATMRRPTPLEPNTMTPRVTAEVRAGEEQVLLHLVRALPIAAGRDQVAYGEIYVASSTNNVLRLASRSEIGRGFAGELRVHRERERSKVEYFVHALPGDEGVRENVQRLEAQIAAVLRTIDSGARVRRAGHPPRG